MSKAPAATSAAVTRSMLGNKGVNTRPEIALRSAMHAYGLRFRVALPITTAHGRRVRPDAVFTRARLAVFVDGCFWHGCTAHGRTPRANADYWAPKLARNVERDRKQDQQLRAAGWAVVRVWEHEILADARMPAGAIVSIVRSAS